MPRLSRREHDLAKVGIARWSDARSRARTGIALLRVSGRGLPGDLRIAKAKVGGYRRERATSCSALGWGARGQASDSRPVRHQRVAPVFALAVARDRRAGRRVI